MTALPRQGFAIARFEAYALASAGIYFGAADSKTYALLPRWKRALPDPSFATRC